jgi:hypothetical protein
MITAECLGSFSRPGTCGLRRVPGTSRLAGQPEVILLTGAWRAASLPLYCNDYTDNRYRNGHKGER